MISEFRRAAPGVAKSSCFMPQQRKLFDAHNARPSRRHANMHRNHEAKNRSLQIENRSTEVLAFNWLSFFYARYLGRNLYIRYAMFEQPALGSATE
jgi:hypothetical protein